MYVNLIIWNRKNHTALNVRKSFFYPDTLAILGKKNIHFLSQRKGKKIHSEHEIK